MAQDTILVVEDEQSVSDLLQRVLADAGYRVLHAADGRSALRIFHQMRPHLVVLDILMPQLNGWEVCQRLREISDVPILILSALGMEKERVRGLFLGADDYLTKPFGLEELRARVYALLRRARLGPLEEGWVYRDAILTFDDAAHEVYVRGSLVPLTPQEYRLLKCLVEHRGQVLTHGQLIERVWGYEGVELASLKIYVGYLRRKIEHNPTQPELIQTIRGVGYRYRPVAEKASA